MALLYQSSSWGSDAFTGTKAAPFQTFGAVYTAASTGDTIFLLDAWDNIREAINGQTYLHLTKGLRIASWDPMRPATIGGASGAFSVRVQVSGITLANVNIATSDATTTALVGSSSGSSFTTCRMHNVKFLVQHAVASTCYAVSQSGAGSHDNWLVDGCELIHNGFDCSGILLNVCDGFRIRRSKFNTPRYGTGYGLRIAAGSKNIWMEDAELDGDYGVIQNAATVGSDIKMIRSKIGGRTQAGSFAGASSGTTFLFMRGVDFFGEGIGGAVSGSNVLFDVDRVTGFADNVGLGFPSDGAYTNVAGTIQNWESASFNASTGHGFVIGAGGSGVIARSGRSAAVRAAYSGVFKGTGTRLFDSVFVGGTTDTFLIKGATGLEAWGNTFIQARGGIALDIRAEGATLASGCKIRGNQFYVTSGSLMSIGSLSTQDGTNIVDYNSYTVGSSATWGTVEGTSVSSLATVRAAWTSPATNDDNSYEPTFAALDGRAVGSVTALGVQAKLDVNAEVDAAIETYHLDHLLANAYDPASKPGDAAGLLNVIVENDGGVPRFTTNALEQGPSGGGTPPTAEAIADAVWDETISGHAASGSTGEALSAAGSAGDPWITDLPGAYASGTAGKMMGDVASFLGQTGSSTFTQRFTDGTDPIQGVEAYITTDSAGLNVIKSVKSSDDLGNVTWRIDPGSYYLVANHTSYEEVQITAITVP